MASNDYVFKRINPLNNVHASPYRTKKSNILVICFATLLSFTTLALAPQAKAGSVQIRNNQSSTIYYVYRSSTYNCVMLSISGDCGMYGVETKITGWWEIGAGQSANVDIGDRGGCLAVIDASGNNHFDTAAGQSNFRASSFSVFPAIRVPFTLSLTDGRLGSTMVNGAQQRVPSGRFSEAPVGDALRALGFSDMRCLELNGSEQRSVAIESGAVARPGVNYGTVFSYSGHGGGTVARRMGINGDVSWIENRFTNPQWVSHYSETSRDENYIYLYDNQRDMWIALGRDSWHVREGSNGTWHSLGSGTWR